jgi:hypothetical protein
LQLKRKPQQQCVVVIKVKTSGLLDLKLHY